jgi:hypothetical protein
MLRFVVMRKRTRARLLVRDPTSHLCNSFHLLLHRLPRRLLDASPGFAGQVPLLMLFHRLQCAGYPGQRFTRLRTLREQGLLNFPELTNTNQHLGQELL